MTEPSSTDRLRKVWNQLTAPGAPFEMTEAQVRGETLRVFKGAPPSMRAVWEASAAHGDANYLVYEDEHLTYAQAHKAVRSLAHYLRDEHQVGPGDRVAVAMRNYPEWVLSYWATLSLGAACVGMNAWWTSSEMAYGLHDSRPKALICDAERLDRVAPLLETLRSENDLGVIAVRVEGDLPARVVHWNQIAGSADPEPPTELPPADIDPDSDACIFYTSGTTGFPKGAQLTHRGCIHNLMHMGFMPAVFAAASPPSDPDPVRGEEKPPTVIMAPTPLFHVTANNCLLHPATCRRRQRRVDVQVGHGPGSGTHRDGAGDQPERGAHHEPESSCFIPIGRRGTPLPWPAWEAAGHRCPLIWSGKIKDAFQPASLQLVRTHRNARHRHQQQRELLSGKAGLVRASRSDLRCHHPRRTGQRPHRPARWHPVGEGPVVVAGYLNKPEATAEAIQDGWFNTGDIARVDEDGFVFIVDRAKDMVLRGGENIYCSEVESCDLRHWTTSPRLLCSQFPMNASARSSGQRLCCEMGERRPKTPSAPFLVHSLAKFKIPERIWLRTEPLPRNANGKFVKRTLRDQLIGS